MDRSRPALVAGLCVVLVTTGCLGVLTGSEPISATATPAEVDDGTLDRTGYGEYLTESPSLTRNVTVAGQTRRIEVTNEVRGYNRTLALGPLGERDLARFVVLSTPAVSVAGQTFNPVGDWSNRRTVRRLTSTYEDLDTVAFDENRTVSALGESRTVSRYTAETTVDGQTVDVYVHLAKFRHGDDFVVALAVHPRQVEEGDRIDTLLGTLRHG